MWVVVATKAVLWFLEAAWVNQPHSWRTYIRIMYAFFVSRRIPFDVWGIDIVCAMVVECVFGFENLNACI